MGFAAAAFVLAGASAGVQAVGAMQSAAAQAASAKYNAQIQAENAQIATKNASYASQEGEANAANQELKNRANVGSMKSNQAAGGVNVNVGSAVESRASAAELGQLDAMTIRSNAARQAYGYLTQAAGYTAQSRLDTAEAKNATTAGDIKAVGSLLGGASSATSAYENYQLQNSLIGGGGGSLNDSMDGEGGYVGNFPTQISQ